MPSFWTDTPFQLRKMSCSNGPTFTTSPLQKGMWVNACADNGETLEILIHSDASVDINIELYRNGTKIRARRTLR